MIPNKYLFRIFIYTSQHKVEAQYVSLHEAADYNSRNAPTIHQAVQFSVQYCFFLNVLTDFWWLFTT